MTNEEKAKKINEVYEKASKKIAELQKQKKEALKNNRIKRDEKKIQDIRQSLVG